MEHLYTQLLSLIHNSFGSCVLGKADREEKKKEERKEVGKLGK